MIKFDAHFGDAVKQVELSTPNGIGAGVYYVLIDSYVQGQIVHQGGKWNVYLNALSELQYEETEYLVELIEQAERERGGV